MPTPLLIDLEALPPDGEQPARILRVAGLRPDTGATLEAWTRTPRSLQAVLQQLDALAEGADSVVGHNLLAHDLPLLQAAQPDLQLLRLPAIDTLRLSPLAFPQNPYHHLIKNYKLAAAALNSPLADCRATWEVLQDEHQAFTRLGQTQPEALAALRTLVAPADEAGLHAWFATTTPQPPATPDQLSALLRAIAQESDTSQARDLKVCRTRLAMLLADELSQRPDLRWPIAYTWSWLRVSGGNSVLAPWVRHQFPEVGRLIAQLRDTPCGQAGCQYCASTHDPRRALTQYFGFPDFRREPDGRTLQHDIVLAGMQGRNVLAILATGGGKSLCYQLPALNRYHRNGSLTIILSPLQSLMKDQVDGLLARNVTCAATLNGMLTVPERSEVLEKVQFGDIGILLVSPEQLRNRAFRSAIAQRQVGAWIFDEAHCLSKWGNDFRPDYLYAARFIKEFSGSHPPPPIGCFTATAKLDVLADIRTHFQEHLGLQFQSFLGTHERTNLAFEVWPCAAGEKWQQAERLLRIELGAPDAAESVQGIIGGAVVFVSSRSKTEELADFLRRQAWRAECFHAGIAPQAKKDVQNAFLRGETQVIVATNAFGMGVDKADIRLVVHADIPGSLENYLQEAGRAGRDQGAARCVLLYDPGDIETQFGMGERSRLSFRDIGQILRKLRFEAGRRRGDALVITAGEILADESVQTSFEAGDRDADTKVSTAIAWLERGHYLRRNENRTRIFPARLALTRESAQARLVQARLPQRRQRLCELLLSNLYGAGPDEPLNTDALMLATGATHEEVVELLKQLEQLGVLKNDTQITVYLRHAIADASRDRLQASVDLETALLDLLRTQAPEADQGGWQDLHLPQLTSVLRVEHALPGLLPLHVARLLKSLASDSDGESRHRASLELRQFNRDYLRLRIRDGKSWGQVQGLGDRRRVLAALLLQHLLAQLPDGLRGKDLLVQTSFGSLVAQIEGDIDLRHIIPPAQRQRAVEHALLYLHAQEVLVLNHGMSVMRRAMTIEVLPERKGPYRKEDFQRLDEHYRERRIQVHVMREYAEIALREVAQALRFVMHYFSEPGRDFLKRYFAGKAEVLALATSEASWRAITGPLNEVQRAIVTEEGERNRLILAGPGSGKTRVVVHRIAFLLRVQRVPAASIIALTFNRHAANEIRQRLLALVGADAIGITVLTYHALAMRLTGTSFGRQDQVGEAELKAVLQAAVDLLEVPAVTDAAAVSEPDDLRLRLLAGYRYMLVDEYQDIDEMQYRLVCALAGRQVADEGKLCLLAVGDDDQNIYAFRDTSNRYIERFCDDFQAERRYLVENYRSTRHVIHAANQLIAAGPARLKAQHPIRIDHARALEAPGGRWQALDPTRAGRVLALQLPAEDRLHGRQQAHAVMEELRRLLSLEGEAPCWDGCAVLARQRRYLAPVQAWCEWQGVPYTLAAEHDTELPLTRLRGFVAAVDALRAHPEANLSAQGLATVLQVADLPTDAGSDFARRAAVQLEAEFDTAQLGRSTIIAWLYEHARELRRLPRPGLFLGSVHAAKGLEFRHVALLDGGWAGRAQERDDERRLFYVGMTRARETLTLSVLGEHHPFEQEIAAAELARVHALPTIEPLDQRFQLMGLADVDLGFAGRQPPQAPVHTALRQLRPGDALHWRSEPDGRIVLLDAQGTAVGRTAKRFTTSLAIAQIEVSAVVVRFVEDSKDPQFNLHLRNARWEVVLPRLVGRDLAP